jgi:hypothetical protein
VLNPIPPEGRPTFKPEVDPATGLAASALLAPEPFDDS